MTFTVIATTTNFKIPLIIVALVVIIFPTPGHITKPLEVSKVDKREKGLTIVEFVVKSNFYRTCR